MSKNLSIPEDEVRDIDLEKFLRENNLTRNSSQRTSLLTEENDVQDLSREIMNLTDGKPAEFWTQGAQVSFDPTDPDDPVHIDGVCAYETDNALFSKILMAVRNKRISNLKQL